MGTTYMIFFFALFGIVVFFLFRGKSDKVSIFKIFILALPAFIIFGVIAATPVYRVVKYQLDSYKELNDNILELVSNAYYVDEREFESADFIGAEIVLNEKDKYDITIGAMLSETNGDCYYITLGYEVSKSAVIYDEREIGLLRYFLNDRFMIYGILANECSKYTSRCTIQKVSSPELINEIGKEAVLDKIDGYEYVESLVYAIDLEKIDPDSGRVDINFYQNVTYEKDRDIKYIKQKNTVSFYLSDKEIKSVLKDYSLICDFLTERCENEHKGKYTIGSPRLLLEYQFDDGFITDMNDIGKKQGFISWLTNR